MRLLIIGGGVIALLSALEALAAGHEVTLCERDTVPNPRGASHDHHRVLRTYHPGDPAATASARRAHHAWSALAARLSDDFYRPVGAVSVLPVAQTPAALAAVPGSRIHHLPQVRIDAGSAAVFEPDAGVLLADRVLAATARALHGHPRAQVCTGRRAVAVDADRATVRFADGGGVHADAVLLALGPRSRDLLPRPVRDRLVLYRQTVLYCRAPGPAWATMPSVRGLGGDAGAWLVPPVAGTPLKLSAASACRRVDDVTDAVSPPRWCEHLVAVWARLIPGFGAAWVAAARDCYYLADEPTGGAALARLGPSVLSFAACGGGSFKFAPLVAARLTALCTAGLTGSEPSEDNAFPHAIL